VTHPYQHYDTACICGQPVGHHDHTGTWDDCPCSGCELDRENFEILGRAFERLIDRLLPDALAFAGGTSHVVPDTFKPQR